METRSPRNKKALCRRLAALCVALILCFPCRAARAGTPELPQPMEGISPADADLLWLTNEHKRLSPWSALLKEE